MGLRGLFGRRGLRSVQCGTCLAGLARGSAALHSRLEAVQRLVRANEIAHRLKLVSIHPKQSGVEAFKPVGIQQQSKLTALGHAEFRVNRILLCAKFSRGQDRKLGRHLRFVLRFE